jgi:uncharacterized paraquat-inducible protein A
MDVFPYHCFLFVLYNKALGKRGVRGMKVCTHCGRINEPAVKYCYRCATKLKEDYPVIVTILIMSMLAVGVILLLSYLGVLPDNLETLLLSVLALATGGAGLIFK